MTGVKRYIGSALTIPVIFSSVSVIWPQFAIAEDHCELALSGVEATSSPSRLALERAAVVSRQTLNEIKSFEPVYVQQSISAFEKSFGQCCDAGNKLVINDRKFEIIRPLGFGTVGIVLLVKDESGIVLQAKQVYRDDIPSDQKIRILEKDRSGLSSIRQAGNETLQPFEIDRKRYILLSSHRPGVTIWDLIVKPPGMVRLSDRAKREIRDIWNQASFRIQNSSTKNAIVDFETGEIVFVDPGG